MGETVLFWVGLEAGIVLGICFTEIVEGIFLAFSNKEEEEETEEVSDEELSYEDEDLEEEMAEKPSLEETFYPRIALVKKRARAEAERKARLEARKSGPVIHWIDL